MIEARQWSGKLDDLDGLNAWSGGRLDAMDMSPDQPGGEVLWRLIPLDDGDYEAMAPLGDCLPGQWVWKLASGQILFMRAAPAAVSV